MNGIRSLLAGLVASALLVPADAFASVDELVQCLIQNDVPCAEAEADALGAWDSRDPTLRAAAAEVHFYAGRYPEAYDTLKAAVDLGYEDPSEDLALYERTLFATSHWVEEERGRFRVRWRPGLDDLLLDDAAEALVLAERHIAPLLGGPPPGETILELYPDERSFIGASSLMKSDVETTGVVALSKWTRLLVTSPRTLGRGYDWTDTIAHEYIHLVVAHRGNGVASVPVWLQEAIAKYLDSRWRDGKDHFQLTVRQQGLLAQALRDDDLVTFEEMHPSLAKLETAERAALAYAQLATLMQFCFERGGEDVLLRVLPQVKAGVDPRVALASGAGFASFDQMMAEWRTWVGQLELVQRKLASLPVQLDGGDEVDLDPLLAERVDLQNFAKIGVAMAERDLHEAALVYFAKATPDDEPPPPTVVHHMAESQLALGDARSARAILEESIRDYPEFPRSHVVLGRIHAAAGETDAAIAAYRDAAELNPFDPEVQEQLAALYAAKGDKAASARHASYVRIQRQGGSDTKRVALHVREGELELPDYQLATKGSAPDADGLIGREATGFDVAGPAGGRVTLAEHAGKVVVLDFWATWCGPCRQMMPHLSELQERRRADGVVVIGLSDEPSAKVRPFLAKSPVSYTIGVSAGEVNRAYGVTSLPTAFVIGRDGVIVDQIVGAGAQATAKLEAAVERALAP